MKEVKVYEEDIQEAYKEACEDARKTLRKLYPGLKLGKERRKEFYDAIELKAHVSSAESGLFLTIDLPNGDDIVSPSCCEEHDGYIWVPFYHTNGIELGEYGRNFKIRRR